MYVLKLYRIVCILDRDRVLCPGCKLKQLWFSLQPGHYSSLTPPNLQHTADQERNDQCGNQQHSRELVMMGIVMPETCWASKKYNKIISGILVGFFYSSVITVMSGPMNIRFTSIRWFLWLRSQSCNQLW